MKDVFFTNLCWRNCETCPPEKIAGGIMLTNGTAVCEGFHAISSLGTPKLYVLFEDNASYERICQEDLRNWWWTDIMKYIKKEFGED